MEQQMQVHPSVVTLMTKHRLGLGVEHDDLDSDRCSCKRGIGGETCVDCGGLMIRTGTCHTCTECGTTGGCG